MKYIKCDNFIEFEFIRNHYVSNYNTDDSVFFIKMFPRYNNTKNQVRINIMKLDSYPTIITYDEINNKFLKTLVKNIEKNNIVDAKTIIRQAKLNKII